MLALADILAALACSAALLAGELHWPLALASIPLWLLAAKLLGLYDRDHRVIRHLTIDELPGILAWAGIVAVLSAATLPASSEDQLSIGTLVALFVLLAGADLLLRVCARWLWRSTCPPARCLVVGEGAPAAGLIRKLELFTDVHMVEAGTVQPRFLDAILKSEPHGSRGMLADIDRVVVATDSLSPDLVARLTAVCREVQVKLSVVSPLHGRAIPAPRISQIADLPVLELDTSDVSRSSIALKRGFDVTIAAVALLLALPFFPLIALAIKLDSRGPIFFTQLRAGLHGRVFRLHKFRTMRHGASLDEVVAVADLPEPAFKLRRDPRLTRVGRILRRLSLDELPQFFNVLRGEMSVVGPRPEQVEVVELYSREDRFRLEVKPGVTGPMQVHGRGELTFAERLAVDLDYIENLSPLRDMRIIALTIPTVLKRNGAY